MLSEYSLFPLKTWKMKRAMGYLTTSCFYTTIFSIWQLRYHFHALGKLVCMHRGPQFLYLALLRDIGITEAEKCIQNEEDGNNQSSSGGVLTIARGAQLRLKFRLRLASQQAGRVAETDTERAQSPPTAAA